MQIMRLSLTSPKPDYRSVRRTAVFRIVIIAAKLIDVHQSGVILGRSSSRSKNRAAYTCRSEQ